MKSLDAGNESSLPGLGVRSTFRMVIGYFRSEFKRRSAVLTGIRGFAALWVFLFHVWLKSGKPELALQLWWGKLTFTPLVSIGFGGITVFFVLSGFLLGSQFAKCHVDSTPFPSLRRYYIRRILRVIPAYYFQLFILMAIFAIINSTQYEEFNVENFSKHLLMLFMPQPLGTVPLNLVWWTLPIEFSFYLLLPILSIFLVPARWVYLLFLSLGIMIFWRYIMILRFEQAPINDRVYATYQLFGSFDMFGIGMLFSIFYANIQSVPKEYINVAKSNFFFLVAVALLVFCTYWLAGDRNRYWANFPIFYTWTPVLSVAIGMAITSSMLGNAVAMRIFGNRLIVYFGVISYSFYLWHLPVIDSLIWYMELIGSKPLGLIGLLTGSLVLSTVISFLSFAVSEFPFLQLGRKKCVCQSC